MPLPTRAPSPAQPGAPRSTALPDHRPGLPPQLDHASHLAVIGVHTSCGASVADIHIDRGGASVPNFSRRTCSWAEVGSPGPHQLRLVKDELHTTVEKPGRHRPLRTRLPIPTHQQPRRQHVLCSDKDRGPRGLRAPCIIVAVLAPHEDVDPYNPPARPALAIHSRTTAAVCSTSDRSGRTNTSHWASPTRTSASGCSRRRHNHGSTPAAVLPAPVGTRSNSGSPSAVAPATDAALRQHRSSQHGTAPRTFGPRSFLPRHCAVGIHVAYWQPSLTTARREDRQVRGQVA